MQYDLTIDGKKYRLSLERDGSRWACQLDGRDIEVDAVMVQPGILSLRIGNTNYEARCEFTADGKRIWVGNTRYNAEVRDPRSWRGRQRMMDDAGPRKLIAPMPGKIVRVLLSSGSAVQMGDGVVVVEAMKMQNEIKSPKNGTVQKILVAEGEAVNAGDVLAIVV